MLNIIDELIKSPNFESGTFPKKGQSMPSKGDRKARYTDFYQCQSLFLTLDASEAMPGYATYINDQENQAANQNKQYDRVGKLACQYINPHGEKYPTCQLVTSHFKWQVMSTILHCFTSSPRPKHLRKTHDTQAVQLAGM